MPSIEVLKKYATLDPQVEDDVLELCMEAAKDWYHAGGVPEAASGPMWDFAVYYLATWYYENRGAVGDTAAILPDPVFGYLNGLRYRTVWPETATDGEASEA